MWLRRLITDTLSPPERGVGLSSQPRPYLRHLHPSQMPAGDASRAAGSLAARQGTPQQFCHLDTLLHELPTCLMCADAPHTQPAAEKLHHDAAVHRASGGQLRLERMQPQRAAAARGHIHHQPGPVQLLPSAGPVPSGASVVAWYTHNRSAIPCQSPLLSSPDAAWWLTVGCHAAVLMNCLRCAS